MILLHSPLLVKLIFTFSAICILSSSGEYFRKSVLIKKKYYHMLGSRLFVEGATIEYFSRIPYAKPPVGNLRFKHPQEIDGDQWEGVYNSTIQPNTCWQAEPSGFDKLNPAARLWYSTTNMSEDCLYLTIWSPQAVNNKNKFPVMVWIYGGSFLSGSSTLEVYDGSVLAAKNEVIVVSMQYRIGPFGFFYLDDNLVPGNQGLMDQNMALTWVKNNIHNFNGDSDKITVFGESAGSVSISLHVLSPLSKNLFNRAIMESATALVYWGIETKYDAKEKSLMLSQYVDCNMNVTQIEKLVKCLQNVDPDKLALKQFDLKNFVAKRRSNLLALRGVKGVSDASYFFDIFMRPVYDGFFVPKPLPLLMEDAIKDTNIEFLMGYNANEGIFFLLYGLDKLLHFFNKGKVQETVSLSSSNPNYIRVSKFLLQNLASNDVAYTSLLPLLLYEYNIPSSILGWKQWNSTQVMSALDQLTGDQNFVCPVIEYAENLVENNKKVYLYSFQHRTEKMTFPKWVGVMHGYEIEYIFGMPFSKKFMNSFYSFTPEEKSLSEYTMTMWTNFAKYGNPTPTNIKYFDQFVSWPTYNTTDKLTFFFGTPQDNLFSPVRKSEKSRKCKFWNKVLPSITEMYRNQMSSAVNQVFGINMVMMLQMTWIAAQMI